LCYVQMESCEDVAEAAQRPRPSEEGVVPCKADS